MDTISNIKTCPICDNSFQKKVNTSKKEWETYKYCSKRCGDLSRKGSTQTEEANEKRTL